MGLEDRILYLLRRKKGKDAPYDHGLFALAGETLTPAKIAPSPYQLALEVIREGYAQVVLDPPPGVTRAVYEDGHLLFYESYSKSELKQFLRVLEGEHKEDP